MRYHREQYNTWYLVRQELRSKIRHPNDGGAEILNSSTGGPLAPPSIPIVLQIYVDSARMSYLASTVLSLSGKLPTHDDILYFVYSSRYRSLFFPKKLV